MEALQVHLLLWHLTVTLPNNASFEAYVTSTSSGVTGDSTAYNIASYTTVYDTTSSFNASTGVFTAPVTGCYMFYACILLGSIGSGNTNGLALFISNGLPSGQAIIDISNWANRRASTNQVSCVGAICIQLNATATVKLQVTESNNGSKNVTVVGGSGSTAFGGRLIG